MQNIYLTLPNCGYDNLVHQVLDFIEIRGFSMYIYGGLFLTVSISVLYVCFTNVSDA